MCGEKTYEGVFLPWAIGSPPRVRGKAVCAGLQFALTGITPACAGKSFLRAPVRRASWDHPRVCGEKNYQTL